MSKENYSELFDIFSNNLNTFIQEVNNKRLNQKATDEWTVKEVLCHITFWHENYAANYNALANNQEPPLLKGHANKLNISSVRSLKRTSKEELMGRLLKANNSLYQSIVVKKVPKMTYMKGSRDYTTTEFLQMIARHFLTHATQVRRAK